MLNLKLNEKIENLKYIGLIYIYMYKNKIVNLKCF